MDKIQIDILEDGTIKVTTDVVSNPNHANAEEFLRLIAELANGGKQERTRRIHVHGHVHHHHHAHEHGHHHHHDNHEEHSH